MNFKILIFVFWTSVSFASDRPIHPYLWKVENGKGISYLLGTIHASEITIDEFHPSLRGIINSSEILATEVGGAPKVRIMKGDAWRRVDFPSKFRLPDGGSLFSILKPEPQRRLLSFLNQNYGFDSDIEYDLSSLRPGTFIYVFMQLLIRDFGDFPRKVKSVRPSLFDWQIYDASPAKKIYLDSPHVVLDYFLLNLGPWELNEFLIEILDQKGSINEFSFSMLKNFFGAMPRGKEPKKSLAAYRNGVHDSVRLAGPKRAESRAFIGRMFEGFLMYVTDRHLGWVKAIEKAINRRTTLVAVGMAHLVDLNVHASWAGESVVQLLRKRGFKVTRVESLSDMTFRSNPVGTSFRCRRFLKK